MKRLPHDRKQLDVLELFETVGQRYNLQIEEISGQQALETFRVETQRQLTPIARHGYRIQAMFGYVAAALGSCELIKTEECGLIFAEQADLGIPDYRVVTKAGQHFLVEVKNCHKLTGALSIRLSYLECVNAAFRVSIESSDLPVDGSDMITKRVESVLVRRFGHEKLDKRRVRSELLRRFDGWKKVADLPDGIAKRAEELFGTINRAFALGASAEARTDASGEA